jgi:hypothetical protein
MAKRPTRAAGCSKLAHLTIHSYNKSNESLLAEPQAVIRLFANHVDKK